MWSGWGISSNRLRARDGRPCLEYRLMSWFVQWGNKRRRPDLRRWVWSWVGELDGWAKREERWGVREGELFVGVVRELEKRRVGLRERGFDLERRKELIII